MGLLRMPCGMSKLRDVQAAQRCIARAASDMGMTEFQVAMVLSFFLESVCEEVGKNRLVTLPGFGTFGPQAWFPRPGPLGSKMLPHCYPAFSASIPFRNLVRAMVPVSGVALMGINHKRNRAASGGSGKDRASRSPFSTQRHMRLAIMAQARAFRMEPEGMKKERTPKRASA